MFFPFSKPSPFSSVTEIGCVVSQKTMNTLRTPKTLEAKPMDQADSVVQKIQEEFTSFHKTMEELHLLKRVASDLKSYRRMIKLKRYD